MSLHSGIDTVAVISLGVYTETYGAAEGGNIANLAVSFGLLENAPEPEISLGGKIVRFIGGMLL